MKNKKNMKKNLTEKKKKKFRKLRSNEKNILTRNLGKNSFLMKHFIPKKKINFRDIPYKNIYLLNNVLYK